MSPLKVVCTEDHNLSSSGPETVKITAPYSLPNIVPSGEHGPSQGRFHLQCFPWGLGECGPQLIPVSDCRMELHESKNGWRYHVIEMVYWSMTACCCREPSLWLVHTGQRQLHNGSSTHYEASLSHHSSSQYILSLLCLYYSGLSTFGMREWQKQIFIIFIHFLSHDNLLQAASQTRVSKNEAG